jgi:hypothetical protein
VPTILLRGALDQIVELIGPEGERVPQFAVASIRPRQLDAALVAAVKPAFKEVTDMPAHLRCIRFEHRLHVTHGRQMYPRKVMTGGPKALQ